MYYVNEHVKNCIRIFPEQGRYDYYRYDMNENPEGLPKEFVDNVLSEITPEFLSTYPEPDIFIEKYANYVGAKYENICVTNGTDMAIRYLLEVFCERGKEVLTVNPSFEMYGVNCNILGLKHVPVVYEEDLSIKIENILNSINVDTNIVVLLNPNNPIGNVYTREEVKKIINKAKDVNAIVIIDEAYYYFYNNTFITHALEEDNVVVLRTFSKLLSLAACRLGVIISNADIINYVKKTKLTFDVNAIALKFGERILDNQNMIEKLIKIEEDGRKYFTDKLVNRGYKIVDCNGNYVLIETKRKPEQVAYELRKNEKVLVKTFGNSLLKPYIRVSTGSIRAMRLFLEKFLKVDG